jgi:probable rRNA maturation factor
VKVQVHGLSLLPATARKAAAVKTACLAALKLEKAKAAGELNVVFMDRRPMRALNRRFLDHDYDTDVIAFRYDDGPTAEDSPFGDVYISAYMARRQASELGHPVLDEVLTLAVHGTLHLLGWDDATPRAKKAMFARQDKILGRR